MTRQAIWQNKKKQDGICTICGRNKLASTLRCGECLKRDLDKKKKIDSLDVAGKPIHNTCVSE